MITKSLDEVFADDLRDPEFVREYVTAALEDGGPDGLLVALRRVANANPVSPALTDGAVGPSATFAAVYDTLTRLGLDLRIVAAK